MTSACTAFVFVWHTCNPSSDAHCFSLCCSRVHFLKQILEVYSMVVMVVIQQANTDTRYVELVVFRLLLQWRLHVSVCLFECFVIWLSFSFPSMCSSLVLFAVGFNECHVTCFHVLKFGKATCYFSRYLFRLTNICYCSVFPWKFHHQAITERSFHKTNFSGQERRELGV